jgi:hypothetical protein
MSTQIYLIASAADAIIAVMLVSKRELATANIYVNAPLVD